MRVGLAHAAVQIIIQGGAKNSPLSWPCTVIQKRFHYSLLKLPVTSLKAGRFSDRRPIATDGVLWSVCLSVCLLVTFVCRAEAAEPIEMPIGGWVDLVGPKEPG